MEKQEVKEIWAPAVYIFESGVTIEFPNYMVSDHGRVKSMNYGKERILKLGTSEDKWGTMHYKTTLWKNNERYDIATHRLVLSSFKKHEYFEGAICDHIDPRTETYCNNHIVNLRWFTVSQNSSTEHCKEMRSKAFINREDQSKRVRVTFSDGTSKEYPSIAEAGRSLGINSHLISVKINQLEGYYKKLSLHFAYID